MSDVTPFYDADRFSAYPLSLFLEEVPWISVTDARQECFMAPHATTYTYGSGRGVRTYTSVPYHASVLSIQDALNGDGFHYNVCFLNRYDGKEHQLGWHSDDSPGMNHEHPIAVVSFGQPREIWWRIADYPGVVPPEQRQLLAHGSLFVMPKGFQRTYQHRIPKGDREMQPRVSLTFRQYIPEAL